MAKTVYEWSGDGETRALTVTNLQTKDSITIPATRAIARVTGLGTHGARTNDELLAAKIIADKSGDIDAIRQWLDGPDRGTFLANALAELEAAKREIAELRKALPGRS